MSKQYLSTPNMKILLISLLFTFISLQNSYSLDICSDDDKECRQNEQEEEEAATVNINNDIVQDDTSSLSPSEVLNEWESPPRYQIRSMESIESEIIANMNKYSTELQQIQGPQRPIALSVAQAGYEYMTKTTNKLNEQLLCRNHHSLCTLWASLGECQKNKVMLQECGPSCRSCPTVYDALSQEDMDIMLDLEKKHGVFQVAEGNSQEQRTTLESIRSSYHYLQHINTECKNRHKLCSFWASKGECEANPTNMKVQCAPACHSCEYLT